MERRSYIPPSTLNMRQNLQPPHYLIGDRITAVQHHREMQSLLIDNQRLAQIHVSLKQELSAAGNELRHLSAAAGKIKAERDAEVHEVYDRAVKMEADVKLIDESNAELAKVLGDLQKLRSEKKVLDEKLNKLRGDMEKVSLEWNRVPVMKAEIETMQKEIQRGRAAIEHEKKVHASNMEQSEAMEKYKIFMAHKIEKLKVEVIDSAKRARAAAAAEAASVPGTEYVAKYGNSEMAYPAMAAATPGTWC